MTSEWYKACTGALVALAVGTGCAFTPAPVLLIEKPSAHQHVASKNLKVGIVVRDKRPEIIQKARVCGTKRNSYMIPTSVVFIAHPEPLDKLVAYHLKRILERAGYDVVGTLPGSPSNLAEDRLKSPPVDWKERWKAQSRNAQEKRPQDAKGDGRVEVADLREDEDSRPWSGVDWSGKADAIVDVKISNFNSDPLQAFFFVSVQGWGNFGVALCDPASPARRVIWGKNFKGIGTSGPRGLITDADYSMAVNMAYWFMMEGIEREVRSEGFAQHVRKAGGSKVSFRSR